MLLITSQPLDFDITKDKLDLSKSSNLSHHFDQDKIFNKAYKWLFNKLDHSEFIWCYKNLNQSGILLIMVIDFLKICERHLRISTQLDHLFMFSLSTLKSFLEHSGFDLVCEDIVSRPDYIKVIARKSSRAPSFDEKDFNSQIYHDSINRLNSLKLNLGFWTNKILKL